MEEIKKNTTKCRIVVEDVYNKDGVLQSFKSYKIVDKDGKLIKCKFKRDVQITNFDGMKKFEAEFGYYSDVSKFYEYPLVWLSDLKVDTIKKLR